MKRPDSNRNHLFLMEIIINILFFSILLSICLQFFSKTYRLTLLTTDLHRAVTACSSAASIFERGDGTLAPLLSQYNYASETADAVFIYLDQDFTECRKEDCVYSITACLLAKDDASPRLYKAKITCYRRDEALYELTACRYIPLTAKDTDKGERS